MFTFFKPKIKPLESRPWQDCKVPVKALAVPTMLSIRERQLLHWFARYHVQGQGRIVDAGCFLGGSTAALASGPATRKDGRWDQTIVSYDLFKVEEYALAEFGAHFPNRNLGAG